LGAVGVLGVVDADQEASEELVLDLDQSPGGEGAVDLGVGPAERQDVVVCRVLRADAERRAADVVMSGSEAELTP
jgi:hypothetical protein